MSNTNRDDELLSLVKNYLDITWTDDDTDAKIRGIVERGMSYLDHIAGRRLDYFESDMETQLLMDYARYVRAGTFHAFAKDFQGELLSLHISGEVTAVGADEFE